MRAPGGQRGAGPRFGPWLWSPALDLMAFGGSAAVAIGAVLIGHATGISNRPMSDVAWIALVICLDVAHVWSTLFRTYLDGDELERRRILYVMTPAACYAAGVALYSVSRLAFWRLLAYVAVFHFVRQQIGWAAVYRARAGGASRVDRVVEDGAIYASTLYPLFVCHTRLPRQFAWFVEGDFVAARALAGWVAPLGVVAGAWLSAWIALEARRAWGRSRIEIGRILVVTTTAVTWWLGLVATNSDFDFTAANVIVHAVPYFVLLWAYAKARMSEAPRTAGSRLAAQGLGAFLALLLGLAFFEEGIWDKLVWHDHPAIFGEGGLSLDAGAEALLVPLLAVPQATHYVLDAVLWRRKSATRAQAVALGFARVRPARA